MLGQERLVRLVPKALSKALLRRFGANLPRTGGCCVIFTFSSCFGVDNSAVTGIIKGVCIVFSTPVCWRRLC